MTIQEAIRECEDIVEGGRSLPKGLQLPGHERHMEFMAGQLEAAKKGAAEEIKIELDKVNEESKDLTLDSVGKAISVFEDTIREIETDSMCFMADGVRFGVVIEPALHTALAALRKVMADLLTEGEVEKGNPHVRVVNLKNVSHENMAEILKQVEGDLEKIFREAAEGKKDSEEEADNER